jgi:hypothetical protein
LKRRLHDDTEKLFAALRELEEATRTPTLYENLESLKNIDNDIKNGNINALNDVNKLGMNERERERRRRGR